MLKLRGSFVALVTPFRDGKVNRSKLAELVNFHIESGTDGIVPCGTTGESATLSHAEHEEVISLTVEAAAGRIPVLAGTGSNSTEEALKLTKYAAKVGADGALVITPYYNKPTQEGLYQHFRAIAEEVPIPIVVYNVPGRTGVNILPDTLARLSEIKNIVGVKEASGNLSQMTEITLLCEEDFILMSGDDMLTLPILSIGGKGVISVTANIAPREVADMIRYFEGGFFNKALELHRKLYPLSTAMFIETNPGPVKTAMNLLGKDVGDLRLPLYRMSDENVERLRIALMDFGFQV